MPYYMLYVESMCSINCHTEILYLLEKALATNNIQIRIESYKHTEIFTVRNYEKPHI